MRWICVSLVEVLGGRDGRGGRLELEIQCVVCGFCFVAEWGDMVIVWEYLWMVLII